MTQALNDSGRKTLLQNAKETFLVFFKWLFLSLGVGAVAGVVGLAFTHSIALVTKLREDNDWIIYFLPVGGLLIVLLYRLFRVEGMGTNQVFKSVRDEKPVSFWLAPAVFISSVITHLIGGSAGREGAALQLGGGISTLLAKLFRLNDSSRHILTLCAMGAVFSALFGTPIGAFVFTLEVVRVGQICSAAVFPALIASLTAGKIAELLGADHERFIPSVVPAFTAHSLLCVFLIAIVGALISILFCFVMHRTEFFARKWFPNSYLRIAIGGTLLLALTLLVGSRDYNGGGIEVIHRIFAGSEVKPEAFLLKILFTAITIGIGMKGGEIVPTLFIGATLGGTLALFTGINLGFGAAVGMATLFCGVTNCPLATLFLSVELFGVEGLPFYALATTTSFLLSGKISLYHAQSLSFSKLKEEKLEN